MSNISTIEQVAAIFEVQNVKARYFRFVDSRDWAGLRALFTDDAVLHFAETGAGPLGVDVALGFISKALEGSISCHHGHMPEVEILSENSARGIFAMEDLIFWNRPVGSEGAESLHGYGHYEDEFERRDGRWLIHRLKLSRLWRQTVNPARAHNFS